MIHTICRQCVHRCKQDESVTLMRCARFHKPVTDAEFAEMVRGLDDLAASADDVRRRARELLQKVRAEAEGPTDDADAGDDEPVPATEETVQESPAD